jgi:3-hydroxy-9,10-secoandrosta-1,3,5(10)-triene-9,17-dione monooxygenase reductase component
VTIHAGDPFATPEGDRSPVRRLRGRLPAAVTLWTTGVVGVTGAALTVSSTLIVDGDPAGVLGVIDEESDLWTALRQTSLLAVTLLTSTDRQLADQAAGLFPAAGGLFRDDEAWRATGYGPIPRTAETWLGARLVDARPVGWGLLVQATIERVELGNSAPLVHYRGSYHTLS